MHGKAKEQAEIDGEKEIVEISTIQAMGKNKYGNVTKIELEEKLNSNTGEGKTEVIDDGENFVVKFIESNRYYKVDNDGNVEYFEVIVDEQPGNIKVGIKGEELKGTEECPFEIWCIEDLVEWSQNYIEYINSYIKLGRTLNFNSNLSYSDGKILNCNSIDELKKLLTDTSESGFTPIAEFSGSFDGNGFEIQNIYINISGSAGLFAKSAGIIQNLGISGNIISSEKNAGGFVGNGVDFLTINNCYNLASVTAKSYAGGIVGYEYASVVSCINCYNNEKIHGGTSGGIFGGTTSGETYIYNCYNIGDITGTEYSGEIMGYQYHTTVTQIKNCYNYGDIYGDNSSYVKEIIGFNWGVPVIDNVYYFKNKDNAFGGYNSPNGTATYCESITNNNLILDLNSYIEDNAESTGEWRKWKKGKNNYPTFE